MYRAYDKAIEYLNSTPQEEYMDLVAGGNPAVSITKSIYSS